MLIRRYSSLRYTYSLSVRLMLLLLFVNTFAVACSSDTASEEENFVPEERSNAITDTASVRRRAPAAPATVSLLSNPFVASRSQGNSLSTYIEQIDADLTLDADAIENRHKSDVTDTIFTLRFGNSMMEFYAPSQSGELLLQVADIQSPDITLRDNLRVGMSQSELLNKLKAQGQELDITQSNNEIIASNHEGAPMSLHFHLKNGKVNRIRYEGYVD
ncbi:hypothetical protein DXT99_13250 [Pontibacter diazotrophicus]|uniref:DUF4292 domain-containing protein n=1 Tax=Pontibacter diazotrophicus TaxID=1400979 RepID=A0A3D8LB24_9BACT|nr:hypothetical protein [Pontibacter diazotrophicus]RDV14631.1 hypothetical protein DXT99_13250 [Pontibacter diazotrophicus]